MWIYGSAYAPDPFNPLMTNIMKPFLYSTLALLTFLADGCANIPSIGDPP